MTTHRAASCKGCERREQCATLALGDSREFTVEALSDGRAAVGDRVLLDIAPRGVLALTTLLYLLPAACAIGGAALGDKFGPSLLGLSSDLAALLSLVVSLSWSLILIRLLHPRLAARRELRLHVTEVLTDAGSPGAQEEGVW